MFKMEMEWKEFNIDLEAIDAKLRQDEPLYVGNQASNKLELFFSEEPSQESKDAIQAFVDGLDAQSPEAISYRSQQDIQQAIQALKQGIPAKSWNDMSAIERKIVMGVDVTKAELIAAQLL